MIRQASVCSLWLLFPACRATAPDEPIKPWACTPRVELSSIWASISERHDRDGDGRVTSEEYDRGEIRFANYDRNDDGVLEAADFPTDTYFNGFSHMMLEDADADADGEVTRGEWETFCDEFDEDDNGRVTRAEVEAAMGPWTDDWRLFLLSFDQDSDGDFDDVDLELTFRDQDYNGDGVLAGKEISGWQPTVERPDHDPPAVGEVAPDFTLRFAHNPDETFTLSQQGARPTALIFGSYT